MTIQGVVTSVTDDGAWTEFTLRALGLLKWTYPRNNVPVLARVIVPGETIAVQVLPHLQPSWYMSDHINHCAICREIVRTRDANALPRLEGGDD